jgi:hypothetical protein
MIFTCLVIQNNPPNTQYCMQNQWKIWIIFLSDGTNMVESENNVYEEWEFYKLKKLNTIVAKFGHR